MTFEAISDIVIYRDGFACVTEIVEVEVLDSEVYASDQILQCYSVSF